MLPRNENPFQAEEGDKPLVDDQSRSRLRQNPILQYAAVIAFSILAPWVFLVILHYLR